MVGLDTNVLVRYLTQDDPAQAARATRLIERQLSETNPGYVGVVVLAETGWVLQRLYRATPNELHGAIADLLDAGAVRLDPALFVRGLWRLGLGRFIRHQSRPG